MFSWPQVRTRELLTGNKGTQTTGSAGMNWIIADASMSDRKRDCGAAAQTGVTMTAVHDVIFFFSPYSQNTFEESQVKQS